MGISYNKRLLVYLGCSGFFMVNILQYDYTHILCNLLLHILYYNKYHSSLSLNNNHVYLVFSATTALHLDLSIKPHLSYLMIIISSSNEKRLYAMFKRLTLLQTDVYNFNQNVTLQGYVFKQNCIFS